MFRFICHLNAVYTLFLKKRLKKKPADHNPITNEHSKIISPILLHNWDFLHKLHNSSCKTRTQFFFSFYICLHPQTDALRGIVLVLYLIHVPALCFYVNFSANSLFCCRSLIFDSKLVIVCLVLELSASLFISPPAVDLFLSAFIFLAF